MNKNAVLNWCAFRMMKGQMTFGSLTAVTQLVNQLQGLLVNISDVIPQYIAMLVAAVKKIPLDRNVKRLFAYVPQGNLILSGTVREDIMITNPNATEDEINNALYIGCADGFVNDLLLGLDIPLKESGAGLSERQLQIIAIARAALGNSPILLLDECISALDEQTETQRKTVKLRWFYIENIFMYFIKYIMYGRVYAVKFIA